MPNTSTSISTAANPHGTATAIMTSSVSSALIALAVTAQLPAHGLLGGVRRGGTMFITHFLPVVRSPSILASNPLPFDVFDSWKNADTPEEFAPIGWFRTVSPLQPPIPTQSDLQLQHHVQSNMDLQFALLISTTTANHPSRFFTHISHPGPPDALTPSIAPVHAFRAFRAIELPLASATGVASISVEADEVFIGIAQDLYTPPHVSRARHKVIQNTLEETKEVYKLVSSVPNSIPTTVPSPLTFTQHLHMSNLDSLNANFRAISRVKKCLQVDVDRLSKLAENSSITVTETMLQAAAARLESRFSSDVSEFQESILYAGTVLNHSGGTSAAATKDKLAPFSTAGIPGIVHASPFHVHLPRFHGGNVPSDVSAQLSKDTALKGNINHQAAVGPAEVLNNAVGIPMETPSASAPITTVAEDGKPALAIAPVLGSASSPALQSASAGALGTAMKRPRKQRKDKGGKRVKLGLSSAAASVMGTTPTAATVDHLMPKKLLASTEEEEEIVSTGVVVASSLLPTSSTVDAMKSALGKPDVDQQSQQ
ncbi:hypothetical protein HDU80_008493 [Chytriomyces hyalinus]|nr:hypothetical protein HDU80_008493 [Chytriomyces hyalinus]